MGIKVRNLPLLKRGEREEMEILKTRQRNQLRTWGHIAVVTALAVCLAAAPAAAAGAPSVDSHGEDTTLLAQMQSALADALSSLTGLFAPQPESLSRSADGKKDKGDKGGEEPRDNYGQSRGYDWDSGP